MANFGDYISDDVYPSAVCKDNTRADDFYPCGSERLSGSFEYPLEFRVGACAWYFYSHNFNADVRCTISSVGPYVIEVGLEIPHLFHTHTL